MQQQALIYGCLRGQMIYLLLLINFVGFDWQLKQMIINLFETTKTTNQTLVIKLT
jgi:hypothetical protein